MAVLQSLQCFFFYFRSTLKYKSLDIPIYCQSWHANPQTFKYCDIEIEKQDEPNSTNGLRKCNVMSSIIFVWLLLICCNCYCYFNILLLRKCNVMSSIILVVWLPSYVVWAGNVFLFLLKCLKYWNTHVFVCLLIFKSILEETPLEKKGNSEETDKKVLPCCIFCRYIFTDWYDIEVNGFFSQFEQICSKYLIYANLPNGGRL